MGADGLKDGNTDYNTVFGVYMRTTNARDADGIYRLQEERH